MSASGPISSRAPPSVGESKTARSTTCSSSRTLPGQLWASSDAAVPVSVAYYRDADDKKPARTMRFSDLREFDKRLVPATMEVTLAKKPKEYTRITYKKLKFGVKIPSSKFTEQALRK